VSSVSRPDTQLAHLMSQEPQLPLTNYPFSYSYSYSHSSVTITVTAKVNDILRNFT